MPKTTVDQHHEEEARAPPLAFEYKHGKQIL